jgi:hypothetical protein
LEDRKIAFAFGAFFTVDQKMRFGFINRVARADRLASEAIDTGFDDFYCHDKLLM